MSRTPETLINKKAQSARNTLIWIACFVGFIAVGALANDAVGIGLLGLAFMFGLFIWASKIKVRWDKTGEVGAYK